MASYDISGDAPIKIEKSPALDCIAQIEKLKAEGAALAKANKWDAAMAKYGEVVDACVASTGTVSCDFESERAAEKCQLLCLCNRSLCAYKLEDYDDAKAIAQRAIDEHKKSRFVDDSGLAKCLYRRGQAQLGLGDSRGAVDSVAQACELEEAQIKKGQGNELSLRAMKRELLRARKVARADGKKSASALKSSMAGFLKAGSKTLTDPKLDRAKLVKDKIDAALKYVFEPDQDKKNLVPPDYDQMISELVQARHEACSAKDALNELALTFAEGFVAFVASAPETDSTTGVEKHYARCADAMQSYWHLREELERDTKDLELLEPPLKIGDVAALECCAHAHMQLQLSHKARPFFERYIRLCEDMGPQAAYHNLPDSFLLQRGLPKMDDSARRISRWRHRAHSPRALFDAHTALCAIKAETDRSEALDHAKKAFGCASDDDEKLTAHRNLSYVLRKPLVPDDPSKVPPQEDLDKAAELDTLAEVLEQKIKEAGAKVDEKTNRVAPEVPEELEAEELGAEEMPALGDDAEE
jgi:tetratricopeptide (TPR) repeat protein